MTIPSPINLKKWIDENRHLLKPPVGNKLVYQQSDDFIVMVVGGPNSRSDYHYEEGEELFYQLEGEITVKTIQDGKHVAIRIQEGEMYLLPARIPHSPQRGPNTIGLVIERVRKEAEVDKCIWYCDNCASKLYEASFPLDDIVGQLKRLMENFYSDESLRTCKECKAVMEIPK